MAYACIALIGTYVYILEVGGMIGGFDEEILMKLVNAAKRNGCKTVQIEKNFGNGAHAAMLRPLFERHYPVEIEEVWESGQKELRIIDVLEPVLSSHRLVVSPEAIIRDFDSVSDRPTEKQKDYMLYHQMANITRDKNCLRHDDRLDALAGAVRAIVQDIDYDMQASILRARNKEAREWITMMNDPMLRRESVTGVGVKRKKRLNRFR